jgi:hypothetical protein
LYKKEYVDVLSNVIYTPFHCSIKGKSTAVKRMNILLISIGFDDLVISSTAFEGIDLLHLSKTILLTKAKYDEFLTRKTSVLVCNSQSPNRDKIKHALEWNIPAVRAEWLWDSITLGDLKPYGKYLIYPSAQAQHIHKDTEKDASEADSTRNQAEGDRKEKDAHGPFADDELVDNDEVAQDTNLEPSELVNNNEVAQDNNPEPPESVVEEPQLRPEPLKERSPNSPTKPLAVPIKPNDQTIQAQNALSDTITSLLTNPKGQSSSATSSNRPLSNRRDRKLLGRATSNLSTRSGPTRASSVDTMNTDGLGTPIESIFPGSNKTRIKESMTNGTSLTTSALISHDELFHNADDDVNEPDEHLQMTQVRYEDPEAGRWRARMMKKIGVGKIRGKTDDDDDDDNDDDKKKKNNNNTTDGFSKVSMNNTLQDEGGIGRRMRRRTATTANKE